tara:strand:- start:1948 stop:2337 length:390 start_codon:yes stop_codon:yes gene_type:complete
MTNSDNTFGTHNKRTQILTQVQDRGFDIWDGSRATNDIQNFGDVDTAKSWFYTDEALTVFNECCTELQWSVVDNQKLKYTMAFGTKGTAGIAAADDWAGQFSSRKQALIDSGGWAKNPYSTAESSDHLF